jgi:beta-mannosidase
MGTKKIYLLVILLFLLSEANNPVIGCSFDKGQTDHSFLNKNLGHLEWKLWGYRPYVWRMNFDFDRLSGSWAEYSDIPFRVPGSVQKALKDMNIVPDWNIGLNFTEMEWIESRHWLIAANIPDEWVAEKDDLVLNCKGLDHQGILFVNGQEAGRFNNAYHPYSFDIGSFLKEKGNTVVFVFECSPTYLGQIGYTSQIREWKPRFYYGWDWVPRIVQVGIWDEIFLQTKSEDILSQLQVDTKAAREKDEGELSIFIENARQSEALFANVSLTGPDGESVFNDSVSIKEISRGKTWKNLQVKRWYPNGWGNPNLYHLKLTFYGKDKNVILKEERKIGFKHIDWLPNKGAPQEADCWICSINNQPIFIQGVNWTPLLPNFADLKKEDYEKKLVLYKEMGINTIRVWGGGFSEKSWLYEFCDKLGILVWQDFPLSSSGLDNYPPDEPETIADFSRIVKHYITRLKSHASLLLWCGGNELYEWGDVSPVDVNHPMIAAIKKIVNTNDPDRRFVPGSPSGPSISFNFANKGKGIHWDTHGPWKLPFGKERTMSEVEEFWKNNDSFFISEAGAPGAMSVELIKKYSGKFSPWPTSLDNPLWRTVNWWNEWDEYTSATPEKNRSLEHYVRWSQGRQTRGLAIALKTCKDKFPACGGFLIWMGHDCFPCPVNTSLIDFKGNVKPVVYELSEIWRNNGNVIYR